MNDGCSDEKACALSMPPYGLTSVVKPETISKACVSRPSIAAAHLLSSSAGPCSCISSSRAVPGSSSASRLGRTSRRCSSRKALSANASRQKSLSPHTVHPLYMAPRCVRVLSKNSAMSGRAFAQSSTTRVGCRVRKVFSHAGVTSTTFMRAVHAEGDTADKPVQASIPR